jgi:hypothetical protein
LAGAFYIAVDEVIDRATERRTFYKNVLPENERVYLRNGRELNRVELGGPRLVPNPVTTVGEIQLYAPLDWVSGSSSGLYPISIDGKWGYYRDGDGRIAVEPQWDFAGEFEGDCAVVAIDCAYGTGTDAYSSGGLWGTLDKFGRVEIPVENKYSFAFGSPLGKVRTAFG